MKFPMIRLMQNVFVLLWLTGSGLAHATTMTGLPEVLKEALLRQSIPLESVSFAVQDMDALSPEWQWNETVPRSPASLMKIVTTYSALMAFGPAKTWETELKGSRPNQEGVMAGPLYVVGGGDPGLTREDWEDVLRALRLKGVRKIDGDLVLDDSLFKVESPDENAFDHQGFRAYNVKPSSLQVGLKAMILTFSVRDGRVMVQPDFPFPEIIIENRLQPEGGPCPIQWKSHLDIQVRDDGKTGKVTLTGFYPTGCGAKELGLGLLSEQTYIGSLFRQMWREVGGEWTGQVRNGLAPAGAPTLVCHESRSLGVLITEINKYSNNTMARTLFLDLGVGQGVPATESVSAQATEKILRSQGMDFREMKIDNGAGLSRDSRISAQHLLQVLLAAARGPWQPEFESSLSIAGLDGTARNRLAGEVNMGHFHVKTGTIDGVSGIAGYVLDTRGRKRAFVLMINDPGAGNALPVQNALLRWLGHGASGGLNTAH